MWLYIKKCQSKFTPECNTTPPHEKMIFGVTFLVLYGQKYGNSKKFTIFCQYPIYVNNYISNLHKFCQNYAFMLVHIHIIQTTHENFILKPKISERQTVMLFQLLCRPVLFNSINLSSTEWIVSLWLLYLSLALSHNIAFLGQGYTRTSFHWSGADPV